MRILRRNYHISYRWRFFIPIIIGMWTVVLGLTFWQASREERFRSQYVESQLDLINMRIVEALNSGQTQDNAEFLDFLNRFYIRNRLFSGIRITIFNKDWTVVRTQGLPIIISSKDRQPIFREVHMTESQLPELHGAQFFYKAAYTSDGEHIVVSALPLDAPLVNYLSGDRTQVWLIIFAVIIVLTILVYLYSRAFSSNLNLLREFARRSASDPGFIPGSDFPHDELGDVARQIVSMYNERAKVRRRLDHEHQVAMKAIEEKAAQKRQLTNNINHELKTPIGVIKGYLDTLVDTPDLDPEMRDHFIRKAREHADRLVELIADVSAITRLAEGANMINTEIIDYHDLVYSSANDINDSGALGHMEFTYDIPLGTYVIGNATLLQGMLTNLARNSANYSSGLTCTLQCNGMTPDGLCYDFSFYDDGVGVPEDSLPHLFERFYRIDSGRTRKSGGTGLGLAIVYNTITALGGTIRGLNRPGAGLEIRFTLPKAKSARKR